MKNCQHLFQYLPDIKRFNLFLVLLLSVTFLFAQNTKDLEAKRNKLLDDIKLTNKLLKETKQNKKVSLSALATIQKQLRQRQDLVNNINNEIKLINVRITDQQDVMNSLEADLGNIKSAYAKLLGYAYKNQSSLNQLTYVLSASSFNDAYTRMRYMNKMSEYRKNQAELIIDIKEILAAKVISLEDSKNAQVSLLEEANEQKSKIESEEKSKNEIVKELSKQENDLLKELRKKQKAERKLNKKIEDAIKKAIAAKKPKNSELESTPEVKALTGAFASNKLKLPWPVSKGVITKYFGEYPHPVLKKIKLYNNGIDISTEKNAQVKAIFEGEIVNVMFNPTFHNAVIVKHGNYFTVYSNLKEVTVKAGQKVKVNQSIGRVNTNDKEGSTEIHFEVWKGTTKLNPTQWLKRK